MDTKIKEENRLSDDTVLQADRELFTKTNTNSVLLGDDCDTAIKMEVDSQTPLSNFDSQRYREFLSDNPVIKVKKCNSGDEDDVDDKVEVKEELWWLETESSSVYDNIKDGDFCSLKSSRSCTEAFNGDGDSKSTPSSEHLSKDTSFCMEKSYHENGHSRNLDCENSNATEIYSIEQIIHSEQPSKYITGKSTYLKKANSNHEGKNRHQCEICEKKFSRLSHLKLHNLIHEGKRPHKCEICEKKFTKLSDLKRHALIHEGKKPFKCDICEKRFTRLSNLKTHHLIHEDEKPYKCDICEKSFTRLADWKTHNLIHEGIKPHKCEMCDKRFTRLSDLRSHNIIHEGKRLHKCEVCEKRFIASWDLKRHQLIHEAKKPFICEICNKRFTALSSLRRHNIIHKRKEPYTCDICENGFITLSEFKRHILIHERKTTQASN